MTYLSKRSCSMSFRLSEEVRVYIEDLSAAYGMSMSSVIDMAVVSFYEKAMDDGLL